MPAAAPFVPDRRLFPFKSRWFQSTVGQVHYIDEGSGPPILFLHGNPTWSFLYRGIVIRLRKRYRCIAVDSPGFGLSPQPADYGFTPAEHAVVMTELVRGLGLKDLTVMGQDWGGPIGIRVALNDPDRIRALVMGNTWYWPLQALHMKAFSSLLSSGPGQRQILNKNAFVERILPFAVKHKLAPEVLAHYRGPFPTPQSRAGVAEFPRQLVHSWSWLNDIAAQVPEVLGAKPLLLTWGTADLAFPASFMDRFRTDFTTVRIERLDAKHYIQEDAPGEIADAIQAFIPT
jgi:haloalkane dehalogenase